MERVVSVVSVSGVAVVILRWMRWQRQRRADQLTSQFGSEYDRTVSAQGDRQAAEQDLSQRQERRSKLELRNLDAVQRGLEPEDWKPLRTIGAGVNEIRVRDATGAYRVIYLATRPEAVYVLHCFQKKTEKTSQHDIELAKKRFKAISKPARRKR